MAEEAKSSTPPPEGVEEEKQGGGQPPAEPRLSVREKVALRRQSQRDDTIVKRLSNSSIKADDEDGGMEEGKADDEGQEKSKGQEEDGDDTLEAVETTASGEGALTVTAEIIEDDGSFDGTGSEASFDEESAQVETSQKMAAAEATPKEEAAIPNSEMMDGFSQDQGIEECMTVIYNHVRIWGGIFMIFAIVLLIVIFALMRFEIYVLDML